MAATQSIAIILCTITVILAFFGRTAEKEYLRGLFSILSVYFLVALAAVSRSFAESELGLSSTTSLIGYGFIALLLVSALVTSLMVYDYLMMLVQYLRGRKKGISFG